jgi:hypothetical protein
LPSKINAYFDVYKNTTFNILYFLRLVLRSFKLMAIEKEN